MSLKDLTDKFLALPNIAKIGVAALPAILLVLATSAGQKNGSRSLMSEPAYAEAIAPTAGGKAFTDEQKKALGDIIKDYLVKNPEVMIEVQTALDEKAQKDQDAKQKAYMAQNSHSVFRAPNSSVAGDPNGDITVVEFFDFNCHFCKQGMPEVQKLVSEDKKVRVVFKELPILSAASEEVAKTALAAKRQGKYWEFHQAMLTQKGLANEATSLKVAESLGLDMAKIKSDRVDPSVKAELDQSMALAKALGVNGTPHFLVGDKSISGAPDDLKEQLEGLVKDFRKTGCSVC